MSRDMNLKKSSTVGTTKGRKSPPSQPSLRRKADVIEEDSVFSTSNDPAVGRGVLYFSRCFGS
jgi:hypothetical protein